MVVATGNYGTLDMYLQMLYDKTVGMWTANVFVKWLAVMYDELAYPNEVFSVLLLSPISSVFRLWMYFI